MDGQPEFDPRARELQEASEEITAMRDLLTDLWNACRPRGPILTVAEERVWARVDYVVHEGSYGWATNTDDPVVKDLDRRVRRIEEILLRAAVTTTREV